MPRDHERLGFRFLRPIVISNRVKRGRKAVTRFSSRWQCGIAVLASVAVVLASARIGEQGRRNTKVTITEEDYFNTPGQIAALSAYSKQFEKSRTRASRSSGSTCPFANLDTKLLTQATGGDLPNLLAVDNPFVSTMISTGQVVPISGLKGFSTKGYYPAVIDEGLSDGQVLQPTRWRAPTRSP